MLLTIATLLFDGSNQHTQVSNDVIMI